MEKQNLCLTGLHISKKISIFIPSFATTLTQSPNNQSSQYSSFNHISLQSAFAYLSTDYGVVVFDLNSNEVKETWRDLGVNGAKLKIFQSTFLGDSIFLGTEQGILVGNLNDNLLDYNNWKRFDQGSFET